MYFGLDYSNIHQQFTSIEEIIPAVATVPFGIFWMLSPTHYKVKY
jgi:hypothetical protein